MFENMEILRMAQASARHAMVRQNVLAENVANADTPGYVRRDVAPFAELYEASSVSAPASDAAGLRATRPGHFADAGSESAIPVALDATAQTSPDGNAVSVDDELLEAVGAKRQFDLALAIFGSTIGVLRGAIGKG